MGTSASEKFQLRLPTEASQIGFPLIRWWKLVLFSSFSDMKENVQWKRTALYYLQNVGLYVAPVLSSFTSE